LARSVQERVVREIRTLRARRRGLETELRQAGLRRGFERDRESHRKPVATAPVLDPTALVHFAYACS
jgi:hypothetical protein